MSWNIGWQRQSEFWFNTVAHLSLCNFIIVTEIPLSSFVSCHHCRKLGCHLISTDSARAGRVIYPGWGLFVLWYKTHNPLSPPAGGLPILLVSRSLLQADTPSLSFLSLLTYREHRKERPDHSHWLNLWRLFILGLIWGFKIKVYLTQVCLRK